MVGLIAAGNPKGGAMQDSAPDGRYEATWAGFFVRALEIATESWKKWAMVASFLLIAGFIIWLAR